MVWAAVVRVAVCGEAQRKKGEGRDVPEGTLGSLERAAKRRCWLGRDSQKEKNGPRGCHTTFTPQRFSLSLLVNIRKGRPAAHALLLSCSPTPHAPKKASATRTQKGGDEKKKGGARPGRSVKARPWFGRSIGLSWARHLGVLFARDFRRDVLGTCGGDAVAIVNEEGGVVPVHAIGIIFILICFFVRSPRMHRRPCA